MSDKRPDKALETTLDKLPELPPAEAEAEAARCLDIIAENRPGR